ncbi:Hypothetical protein NTJ_13747 [Nesidiocoris tenuis]|uniref:Set2 Rpb1 interacting domain-containing protein n=1 Tax=Nesidiocoris tenuis TaxID=355587 RepID=A0ABN7B965_9HEMI|nr:Hypothetical protein NTJ_13747 [Nesidiocoris tenuis]
MGMSSLEKSSEAFKEDHEDPWYVDTDEEEEDDLEDDDDQQLTLLVRKSYLTHLTRCLKKNYEEFSGQTADVPDESISRLVTFHAKYLEKRALRASMRVGVYQRCMVQQIDEIKKASKQSRIHPTFSERRPKTKEFSEKETQTEELENTEMRQSLTKAFGLSPDYPGGNDQYDELLNILTATQVTPSHSMDMETGYDSSALGQSTGCEMDTTGENDSFFTQVTTDAPKQRMNLDDRLKQLGLMFDDEEDETGETAEPSLEPQVAEFHDCTTSVVEPALKMHRGLSPSDWARELTIQADLLQAVLDRKSPLMRAIIERRFRDLFGVDQPAELVEVRMETYESQKSPAKQPMSPTMDTGQEGFIDLRRTAAGYVVSSLTPYFLKRRIASRQIFKYLARRITDRILGRTQTPDPAMAKKEVKICFAIQPDMKSTAHVDEVFQILSGS